MVHVYLLEPKQKQFKTKCILCYMYVFDTKCDQHTFLLKKIERVHVPMFEKQAGPTICFQHIGRMTPIWFKHHSWIVDVIAKERTKGKSKRESVMKHCMYLPHELIDSFYNYDESIFKKYVLGNDEARSSPSPFLQHMSCFLTLICWVLFLPGMCWILGESRAHWLVQRTSDIVCQRQIKMHSSRSIWRRCKSNEIPTWT